MSNRNPTIGVVIVSFNTCTLLRECLDSLRVCTLPRRTIVVDNGSYDGSADLVRTKFPAVELVALQRNVGFASGTNVGLRFLLEKQTTFHPQHPTRDAYHADANLTAVETPDIDYILLLNPDTVVHPGAIESLVAFLEAHPRVGAVGPRLLNPDGSIQPAAFRFPTLTMTLLDLFPPGEILPGRLYNSWWHGRYHQECHGHDAFPIDHPLGACMLVRPETVAQIGLLDESFFMYTEEIDWCYRIRQNGWAIWQVPAAYVTHVGGAATGQFRARMLIALHESRMRFFRKHYTSSFVFWHRTIVRAGMLRMMLLVWRDYLSGTLTRKDLAIRLATYGRVMQL